MNAYCFRIVHGPRDDYGEITDFVIFTDDKEKAEKYCRDFAERRQEEEPHWWRYWDMRESDPKDIPYASVRVID